MADTESSSDNEQKQDPEPHHRSAKTGHYVEEIYAKRHPDTTVSESRENDK